ncbi:MAG: putative ATPase [Candidatus Tokpelaia sp. JSC085]|nr:MAG: putative ATPase [Candidatus Tokpelaia sp. JSC085]
MGMLRKRYDALVEIGSLYSDSAQASVVSYYDALLQMHDERLLIKNKTLLDRLFSKHKRKKKNLLKGLYVYGDVGRGKTMLMDLFFSFLPDGCKRRVHFNDFMHDVHDRIKKHHKDHNLTKEGQTRQWNLFDDLATTLVKEAYILCLDEFTVTDIADAMILDRLFVALFRKGVVFVSTSNVAPDELYRDGLNRQCFLPFISVLKEHVNIVSLDVLTDYRRKKKIARQVTYIAPLNEKADEHMDTVWTAVTGLFGETSVDITVHGHVVKVPRSSGSVARFYFSDLCSKPLSACDYIALVAQYRTFFIDHVPLLDDTCRNETKRFILLIDTLYDHHVRLFISADARPDQLYRGHIQTTETFEFKRTASRLFDMQSSDYLQRWTMGDS